MGKTAAGSMHLDSQLWQWSFEGRLRVGNSNNCVERREMRRLMDVQVELVLLIFNLYAYVMNRREAIP